MRGIAVAAGLAAVAAVVALALHGGSSREPHLTYRATLQQTPIAFAANHGQAPRAYAYTARGRDWALGLGDGGATLSLPDGALALRPVAGALGRPTATRKLRGVVNVIHGNDQAKWKTGIPTYASVGYDDVWPGVGLRFGGDAGALEYDFLVAPNADPRRVALKLDGAAAVRLDTKGDIHARVGKGDVVVRKPISFQTSAQGQREPVDSRFRLDHGVLRVALGSYDRTRPLVIDPVIAFGTYLGGSDNDEANGVAVDGSGNVIVVGDTASTNLPTRDGTTFFQGTNGGQTDAFVTKYNPAGTDLLYSTYLGGSFNDYANAVTTDATGNAYLTGTTTADDSNVDNFPTVSAAVTAYQGGASDGFVTKLNTEGNIVYSTYAGGDGDDNPNAISVMSTGEVAIAGRTSGGLPILKGSSALQFNYGGGTSDAFLQSFSANGATMTDSSPYGGEGSDLATGLKCNAINGVYRCWLSGETTSGLVTWGPGSFQQDNAGGTDGFVAEVNFAKPGVSNTDSTIWRTFLGGPGEDTLSDLALDPSSGNVYVVGRGQSNYPVTAGAVVGALAPGTDEPEGVLSVLNAGGTGLVYSSFLGTGGVTSPAGLGLIGTDAVIAGSTNGRLATSSDALQPTAGGQGDAFVLRESTSATPQLVYSSYLGGAANENANDVALDASGNPVIVGSSDGSGTPTTPGVTQPTFAGAPSKTDAFVIRYDLTKPTPPVTTPTPTSTPTSTPTAAPTETAAPTATATATAEPTVAPTPTPTPEPVRGKTFNLARAEGKVLVKVPGKGFVDIATVTTIPTGSVVDTTDGKATLFTAGNNGNADGMDFYDGVFKVQQASKGDPTVTITLVGGDLNKCPKGSLGRKNARSVSTHKAKKQPKRSLWGSGKGKFRTVGGGSSAAVRGTQWLTTDTCDTTTVRVVKGTVAVTDTATGAVKLVTAKHSVTAPFSIATLRAIQKGGKKAGTLTAKARLKLKQASKLIQVLD